MVALSLVRKLATSLCLSEATRKVQSLTYLLPTKVIAAKTLTLTGWFGALICEILCSISRSRFKSAIGERGNYVWLTLRVQLFLQLLASAWEVRTPEDAATEFALRTPVS
jgi:hypothetical protein